MKVPVEWLFDANISLCKLLGKLCAVTLDNNAAGVLSTTALFQHVSSTAVCFLSIRVPTDHLVK